MGFKIGSLFICIALVVLFFSCVKLSWEPVSSSYESELNVFGIVRVDSCRSFVIIRNTLGLDEKEYEIIGRDTICYGTSCYEYNVVRSKWDVYDADVRISCDGDEYRFVPIPCDYHSRIRNPWIDSLLGELAHSYLGGARVVYIDTTGAFEALPEQEYRLNIRTKDGRVVMGSTTTPDIPTIVESSVPDTVRCGEIIKIRWRYVESAVKYILQVDSPYIPGREWILEKEDTTMAFVLKDERDIFWNPYEPESDTTWLKINVIAVDENYNNYFIERGTGDVSFSIFIGMMKTGITSGIEGAYGTFASYSRAGIERIIVKK